MVYFMDLQKNKTSSTIAVMYSVSLNYERVSSEWHDKKQGRTEKVRVLQLNIGSILLTGYVISQLSS